MNKCLIISILLGLILIGIISLYFFFRTEKFFKEPRGLPHYDKRYFTHKHSRKQIQDRLRIMFCVLMKFLESYKIKCWLGFGTLLGYYRDKDIIPWDDDIDVNIMYGDLFILPTKHSMNGYIWEVNPYSRPYKHDGRNSVSARLICIKTGIFIDVFSNYIDMGKVIDSGNNKWDVIDVFPIIKTSFLGCETYIPNNIKQVLIDYYGDISIPRDKIKEYAEYKASKNSM